MAEEFIPYKELQFTDYDWLPEVPKHWEKRSIRSLTRQSDKRNGNRLDLELLSVYREFGVIKKASRDDNHNVESLDLSNYKYVGKGCLVMNKMKMWQGSLGVSNFEGIVSPAYIVCSFTIDANLRYFHYLLRSATFKTHYNRISYGIRVGQWDMRYSDFKNLNLFIPPRPEQDQIVKFLDYKISRINKYIKAKNRGIELLKELNHAEINRAVTKGLDPDAPMKESGIEWLGQIPAHWEVNYLSQVSKEQSVTNRVEKNQNLLSLSYGKIVNKDINTTEGLLPASFDTYQIVRKGNIILRLTDLQNDHKSLRTGLVTQKGIITTAYTCIIPNHRIIPEYLYLLLHSFDICKVFYGMGGGLRQSIGFKEIRRLRVLLPPLNEQKIIIEKCNIAIERIEKMISGIEKQITHIEEFKASLISEVVTGKIDVRDVKIEDEFEPLVEEETAIDEEMNEEN